MKFKETGFRALYHQFTAFPLSGECREAMAEYPGIEGANCLLAYGFIDREEGLTLEVLAAGFEQENKFVFFDPPEETPCTIRAETVEEQEFTLLNDRNNGLRARYAEKLALLAEYAVSEEIEKTREMRFLDDSRHPCFPDDVQVYLMRDGLKPEVCWTRICDLDEHFILGVLLNEPEQDFAYHQGEKIAFFVEETRDKKVICYSNMNPSKLLRPEDLEDGSMLRQAIRAYYAEGTEETFLEILETLRDSWLWIPCNAVPGEAAQKAVAEMMDQAGGDPAALAGMEPVDRENSWLFPEILQSGDAFFFPAFISQEDMGEYGQYFTKVRKPFPEVIALARNNEKQLSGIVINAFTQPWILDREIFDIVEKMKSRLLREQ